MKGDAVHYIEGGRFVGRGRVIEIARYWAACDVNAVRGALLPSLVTCKRCLRFLKHYKREYRP